MLQFFFKTRHDEKFQQIPKIRKGCWVHLDLASQDDLEQLSQIIKISPEYFEDCLDKYEIPKIEKVENSFFIFTRYPTEHEGGLYTSLLTLILTPSYLITICPHESLMIRKILLQTTKFSSVETSKTLLLIMLQITHEYTQHIRKVRHDVLKQENEMISVESEDITILIKNEEILNQYLSALVPLRNLLQNMTSSRYPDVYQKDHELMQDLLNTVKQSEELCSISLKGIRSLRDSYQIIFTNSLNKTIKILTSLTILFSIPTTIAGIYGMNVRLPFGSYPLAFPYILGFTGLIIGIAASLFRRKRWI